MSKYITQNGSALLHGSSASETPSSGSQYITQDINGTNIVQFHFSGKNTTKTVYINIDTTSIPSDATITLVSCQAKLCLSTTSRISSATAQIYSNTTAKGSSQSFLTSSATTYTINCGNLTRQELQNLRLGLIVRTAGQAQPSGDIMFYGLNFTVSYTYQELYYEVTIITDQSLYPWSISYNDYMNYLTIEDSNNNLIEEYDTDGIINETFDIRNGESISINYENSLYGLFADYIVEDNNIITNLPARSNIAHSIQNINSDHTIYFKCRQREISVSTNINTNCYIHITYYSTLGPYGNCNTITNISCYQNDIHIFFYEDNNQELFEHINDNNSLTINNVVIQLTRASIYDLSNLPELNYSWDNIEFDQNYTHIWYYTIQQYDSRNYFDIEVVLQSTCIYMHVDCKTFIKLNNAWNLVNKFYKKQNDLWVEMTEDEFKNYIIDKVLIPK